MANILCVDDEPPILMLEKFILEQAGHVIFEAYNGQDALKALGVDPSDSTTLLPDLMVLDVMMPLLDGYSVSLRMKDHPRARTIPIIVVTAKSDMRKAFEEIPVAAFLTKPFDPELLSSTVDQVLNGKKIA